MPNIIAPTQVANLSVIKVSTSPLLCLVFSTINTGRSPNGPMIPDNTKVINTQIQSFDVKFLILFMYNYVNKFSSHPATLIWIMT